MKLVIIGKSGQGRVVADIARANGIDSIVFLDDNTDLHPDGTVKDLDKYLDKETKFIVAIGKSKTREKIVNLLESKGANFATLVHPSAVVSPSAKLAEGTVVMPNAVINADATIGKHVIVNTTAVVEHDCIVGDYSHVSVGAKMGGTCHIGKHVWLGIGSIVSNNIDICDEAFLGAGAVVVKNITKPGIYLGIPAVLKEY